jgi:hypothetical protein
MAIWRPIGTAIIIIIIIIITTYGDRQTVM